MRKWLGRKLRKEPMQKPDNPEVLEVSVDGMKADVHREQYEKYSEGRVSMLVPELPWQKNKKSNREEEKK